MPGRQRPRRVRVGERVERVADAEHRTGQRAPVAGQGQLRTGRRVEAVRPHPLHQRLRLAFAPGLQAVAIDEVQRTQGQRRITFGATVGQGYAVAALDSGGEAASSQSASAARVSKCRSRSEEHTYELQSLM